VSGAEVLSPPESPPGSRRGTVVLLHGLNRTHLSMAPLAWTLRRAGYRTLNLYYPSRRRRIDEHADALLARLRRELVVADGPFHFVGHSLGCIVTRAALRRCAPDELPRARLGRCVMLGPPNHGSEMALLMRGSRLWRLVYGELSFHELAVREGIEALGTPPLPCGVIAGARGDGRGWNPALPGDDDGVVTLDGTHLPGEADHLVLRAVHTVLPWKRETARQVLAFLATGRFARMPATPPPQGAASHEPQTPEPRR
jgi:pimeloyl-ACP methyl ester carboxylesterase